MRRFALKEGNKYLSGLTISGNEATCTMTENIGDSALFADKTGTLRLRDYINGRNGCGFEMVEVDVDVKEAGK